MNEDDRMDLRRAICGALDGWGHPPFSPVVESVVDAVAPVVDRALTRGDLWLSASVTASPDVPPGVREAAEAAVLRDLWRTCQERGLAPVTLPSVSWAEVPAGSAVHPGLRASVCSVGFQARRLPPAPPAPR